MKIERACQYCGKKFFIIPSRIKKGEGKFCSRECSAAYLVGENSPSWRGGKIKRVCEVCGKEFYVDPSHVKNGGGRFCCRSCRAIYKVLHSKKKNTLIERLMEAELKRRCLKFISQFPVGGIGIADFFLPDSKIIIECDGDYWHKRLGREDKDTNRDFQLNFKGYKTYRFWESEIKESAKRCVSKVLRENPVLQVG